MPVSVNAVLRDSLALAVSDQHQQHNNHQFLQSQITSTTKHLVLKTIEYEEYPENFLSRNDALKNKYIFLSSSASSDSGSNGTPLVVKKTLTSPATLNGTNGLDTSTSSSNGSPATPTTPKKQNKNELPLPKRTLFARDKVKVGWKGDRKWSIGAGFINVGNTCYLNSTLQALLHVPAMANWLAADTDHRERCHDMCTICCVAKTLQMSQGSAHAVKPIHVVQRLRQICKHMAIGRQEDAHEFLRYLIDGMEKAYLQRFGKHVVSNLEQYSKETTPLNQILGGYLRSSVRCLSCNHVSITFQHFEDLLLDIRKSNTVDEALQGHFAREKLEDMGYTCDGCKKKVSATKQFSLERPPVVLCIQLKRFTMHGTKINKQVAIKPKLDLTPYVQKVSGTPPLTYRLVSMVTHLGSSQHCGHYTAIGLTESGTYYEFDDCNVRPISLPNVMQTNAYIIFYELEGPALYRSLLSGQATNGVASPSPSATVTTNGHNGMNGHSPFKAVNNGVAKQLLNGSSSTNGNGSASFIGPVLPPSLDKAAVNGQNGHGPLAPQKDTAPVENGVSNGMLKLYNKTQDPTVTIKKFANGSVVFKKYPSAELLFKSPAKQGETVSNGVAGKWGYVEREKPAVVQQISPKSLVPYNSNLSSDDEEEEQDDKLANDTQKDTQTNGQPQTTPSPVKQNGNGHFTPYVKSNSGIWKVCSLEDTESEASIRTKGSGGKVNGHQNGNGKALNELLKQDHNAYGGVAVNTWSGEKSKMDKEISAEKNLKRASDRKTDDEEMDRGHTKKIKLNNNQLGRDNPGFNQFQEQQNRINHGSPNTFRPHYKSNHHHQNRNHNGNGRSDWLNNGRPSGNGQGHYKSKFQNRPGGNHNNNKQRHNNNFRRNKQHGNNRFNGNYSRNNSNNHHSGKRN